MISPLKKKRKYRNEPIVVDGIRWDSLAEAARYVVLVTEGKSWLCALEIKPVFRFACGTKYIPDFSYYDFSLGEEVVEDVKGVETRDFKIKKKMMLHEFGIEVEIRHFQPAHARDILSAYTCTPQYKERQRARDAQSDNR